MNKQEGGEIWDHYRIEEQLLIQSVNAHLRDEDAISPLLQEDIDWQYTVDTACEHSVTQMLYQALREYGHELTPQEVIDELRARSQQIAQRNLQYTQALLELVSEIRAHDIPVIPYRGPVLAAIAYGDIGLRQFSDLDLFVYQDDIPAVKELLLQNGYEPRYWSSSTKGLTQTQERMYIKFCRDYQFKNEEGIEVELHWKIVSRDFPSNITMENVWDHRIITSIGGEQMDVLSPEDRLLMLLVHGSRHRWERFGWVVDIVMFFDRNNVDIATVWKSAEEQNCKTMVALGLAIASDLFNIELPVEVSQYCTGNKILSKRHGYIFNPLDKSGIKVHMEQAELLDRDRDLLRFWLWLLISPDKPTIEQIALPERMSVLYRVARFFRLLKIGVERVLDNVIPTRWLY